MAGEASSSEQAGVQQTTQKTQEATPQAAVSKAPPPFVITPMAHRRRYLKLLIYGGFGTGKTMLAGSSVQVPQMRDVLMVTAEGGEETLEDIVDSDYIDVVRTTTYRQVSRVQEFLKAHCIARDKNDEEALIQYQERLFEMPLEESGRLRRYNTVIIDSGTEVEQYCMYQLLGITDSTRLDEETASAEWTEYKKNHQMVQRMIRSYRDLPMHVIMTAAQQYNQDEQKKYKYSPQFTGKLSTSVQGFMDMVGYLVVAQPTGESKVLPRRLYIQPSPSGRFDAKNRFSRYQDDHFDISVTEKGYNDGMAKILGAVGLLKK